jgi:hypothetical protein
MEFFDLPKGYDFGNVVKVHDHSFLSVEGELGESRTRRQASSHYSPDKLFRERVFFTCYVEGL